MDLKFGDYLLYNNSVISQRIGRVEDYNVDQGWFEVFEYVKSSDTKKGNWSIKYLDRAKLPRPK